MDINSTISAQSLSASRLPENPLNLKIGQQLDVKVLNADIQAAKNTVTLSLGGKEVTVQSNQPTALNAGQDLKIQVTQVSPAIEFKVLEPSPGLKNPAIELRLKVIPTASGKEAMRPAARDGGSAASGEKQPLEAKIISIAGNKIQLQVFTNTPSTTQTSNKQAALITIDRAQLSNAPSNLKVGQSLNLEVVKTGITPQFKITPATNNIPEAKITEFTKQFLPRHEASPIFLNQLIKDLPRLMKNASIPQALKDIAAKIVQNLPPKEQLITSQGLKSAIVNSGLFLEAKVPSAMTQAELIKELPQLIKNESVPQSLQRIAAEILQNLTPKESLVNNGPGINSRPLQGSQLVPAQLNQPDTGNNAPKAGALGAEDFKANLLKFIQALKQEITAQDEQPLKQVDLDLLKNLQHKTENTVAKLVLDQLMSLPKEDNPKQLWIIDIPFIDRQQAESVRIEVQQDKSKENEQQSGNGDWSVNITITPPGLGTIHCIVSYQNDVINTFFKSQNTQTTELIKHNLNYLKNQLEESGLKTGHMDAHAGSQKIQPAHRLSEKKLFDDKA